MIDMGPGKEPRKLPVGDEWKKDIVPGVPNHHVESCGVPPTLDMRHPTQVFENELGEQGVMQFDLDTGICRVWMGDCGWDNEIRVEEVNGNLLVRYLTPEEGGEPDDPETIAYLESRCPDYKYVFRQCAETLFGKLTEEEYQRAQRRMILRPDEYRAIERFYQKNEKARKRIAEQRVHLQKLKDELRLWEEALSKRQTEVERQTEKLYQQRKARQHREEVEEVRRKIRHIQRLLKGEITVDPKTGAVIDARTGQRDYYPD